MTLTRAEEQCDVVIVGGGTAAFEAAVAAKHFGANKVVMLEKAPEAEFGGNPRYSHTGFRLVHRGKEEIPELVPDLDEDIYRRLVLPPYTAEDFLSDLNWVTRGRIDQQLARTLVEGSNPGVRWMQEMGIKWELDGYYEGNDGHAHAGRGMIVTPKDGGLGQLERWKEIALGQGVDLRYESPVTALYGDDRRVEGVGVKGPGGDYDIAARAVILCSGGFQANRELRARYLTNADLMKVRGSKHNTGEVTFMALALGAKPAGQWQGCHAIAVYADAPDVESGGRIPRYGFTLGITVDSLGQRFFDEGEREGGLTYAKFGLAILAQPDGKAYHLFDREILGLERNPNQGGLVEAQTIGQLATSLGIDPAALERAVEEFNAALRKEIPFDQTKPDGRCSVGLNPNKSNWALALQHPPFYAQPVTGGITFTFGGLGVDTNARVLNTREQPIRGLYASGDILGLFYFNYPAGSGQTRNVVFSLYAAAHAVEHLIKP